MHLACNYNPTTPVGIAHDGDLGRSYQTYNDYMLDK